MSSPPFFLRNSRASKTQVPLMSLEVRCKWLNLMGKLSSIFELISQRGRRGFLPGSWSWKTLQWIEFRQKKWHFFFDWSRSLPDQNDQRWPRPFKAGTVVMHPWRPRGSQSAKKLSSRLFSWPDWLPLGLRGYWWWLCNKGKKNQNKKKQ